MAKKGSHSDASFCRSILHSNIMLRAESLVALPQRSKLSVKNVEKSPLTSCPKLSQKGVFVKQEQPILALEQMEEGGAKQNQEIPEFVLMLSSIHQCNGASWLRVIVESKNAQEAVCVRREQYFPDPVHIPSARHQCPDASWIRGVVRTNFSGRVRTKG